MSTIPAQDMPSTWRYSPATGRDDDIAGVESHGWSVLVGTDGYVSLRIWLDESDEHSGYVEIISLGGHDDPEMYVLRQYRRLRDALVKCVTVHEPPQVEHAIMALAWCRRSVAEVSL